MWPPRDCDEAARLSSWFSPATGRSNRQASIKHAALLWFLQVQGGHLGQGISRSGLEGVQPLAAGDPTWTANGALLLIL